MRYGHAVLNSFALMSVVAVAATSPAQAQYAEQRYIQRPYAAFDGNERRGCYWIMQHQYCGRYCYTEVDGKRYCRERERLAYPQGLFFTDGPAPMKLGAERR